MQELAVERRLVPVAIRFAGQEVLRGQIFLSPMAKRHAGPETVLDLMNDPEPFFVLRVEEETPVRMINKERIVEVEIASAEQFGEDEDPTSTGAKEEPVSITFQDDFVLAGTAYVEMPAAKSRLIDFLNIEEKFFALRAGDSAHIVSRKHISHVKPGR